MLPFDVIALSITLESTAQCRKVSSMIWCEWGSGGYNGIGQSTLEILDNTLNVAQTEVLVFNFSFS